MANILRMDLYRVIRSKSFWILLGTIVALTLISIGSITYALSPEFARTMENAGSAAAGSGFHFGVTSPGGDELSMAELNQSIASMQQMFSGLSLMALVGNIFLNGGALALVFVIFVSIFFAAEFENGFSKNVFTALPNRAIYLCARAVEIVLFAALFVLVTVLSVYLCAVLFGIEIVAAPLGDMALWFALVVLVVSGMGMLTALLVWLTRKMAAGIAVGFVVSSGFVVSIVQGELSLFPQVADLGNFTLYACLRSLGSGIDGELGLVHVAVVGLVFLVGYGALSLLVLKKKDI